MQRHPGFQPIHYRKMMQKDFLLYCMEEIMAKKAKIDENKQKLYILGATLTAYNKPTKAQTNLLEPFRDNNPHPFLIDGSYPWK